MSESGIKWTTADHERHARRLVAEIEQLRANTVPRDGAAIERGGAVLSRMIGWSDVYAKHIAETVLRAAGETPERHVFVSNTLTASLPTADALCGACGRRYDDAAHDLVGGTPAVSDDSDWVGITCLGYRCPRGCELIPCEGPAEPGWTWVEEHGWVCPDCIGEWPRMDALRPPGEVS